MTKDVNGCTMWTVIRFSEPVIAVRRNNTVIFQARAKANIMGVEIPVYEVYEYSGDGEISVEKNVVRIKEQIC